MSSDRELLAAHRAGDPAAFGELFARHRDRLWAVALRTVGDPEEAADALQDAIVSAFTRADSFRGEAEVTTWLHRIVVNACLDRLRRAKVRRGPSLDETDRYGEPVVAVGERGAPGATRSASANDPEAAALRTERDRALLAALRDLPVEQRAALGLVDMHGLPVSEAASILGCPEGTVKSRCARGRARLAVALADLQRPASSTPTSAGGTAGGTARGSAASQSSPTDPPTTEVPPS